MNTNKNFSIENFNIKNRIMSLVYLSLTFSSYHKMAHLVSPTLTSSPLSLVILEGINLF